MTAVSPLHRQRQGSGPVVVLSHALGLDLHMWDAVADALAADWTVLRYDHRGHGRSPAEPGRFTVEDLADDAAALIREETGGDPVHFVGLSMGGMTAQALAVRAPELLRSIVVAHSSAHYPERAPWQARVEKVRAKGVAAIADGAVERWLTPGFRATPAGDDAARALHATLVATPAESYAAACEAVAGIDFRESNRRIAVPALVVAGRQDLATPPAMSRQIADAIPGARLAEIDAAHIGAVERPDELAALIHDFLCSLP